METEKKIWVTPMPPSHLSIYQPHINAKDDLFIETSPASGAPPGPS